MAGEAYALAGDGTGRGQWLPTGINDAGTVTGWSRDAGGVAHGFVFNASGGSSPALVNIGGFGDGEGTFPQHINSAGVVAGFSPLDGNDRAFRFSPPNITLPLGTLAGAAVPAESAAYGMNDAGRVVGIASSPSGFNRSFRTDAAGAASSLSTDTHAFLFTDAAGMTDLQTLGGYTSAAYALNNSGIVVGTAEILNREQHAFVWTASGGMRRSGPPASSLIRTTSQVRILAGRHSWK